MLQELGVELPAKPPRHAYLDTILHGDHGRTAGHDQARPQPAKSLGRALLRALAGGQEDQLRQVSPQAQPPGDLGGGHALGVDAAVGRLLQDQVGGLLVGLPHAVAGVVQDVEAIPLVQLGGDGLQRGRPLQKLVLDLTGELVQNLRDGRALALDIDVQLVGRWVGAGDDDEGAQRAGSGRQTPRGARGEVAREDDVGRRCQGHPAGPVGVVQPLPRHGVQDGRLFVEAKSQANPALAGGSQHGPVVVTQGSREQVVE